jgi:tetratricopeptide (TPR) repeat protein
MIIGGHAWWRRAHRALQMSNNGDARDHYLKARYEIQSESLDQLLQAYTNLNLAVERDPKFTAAYFRMLELYWTFFGNIMPPYTNQLRNLRMVADRLRKTAPSSAEYHVVNSWVCFTEWKFEEAIQEAALAKRIDPDFVRAHGLYAYYVLLARGDTATARKEIKIAEDLEPDDVIIQSCKGYSPYAEGEYDLAIQEFSRALELEPRSTLPHLFLARAYEASTQYANALREYEAFDLARGAETNAVRSRYEKLSAQLRDKGPMAMWEMAYDEAVSNRTRGKYDLARICVRLGKNDEAIRLLNEAYERHEWMTWLREDDCWQALHIDPGYQGLLKKMGFSPFPQESTTPKAHAGEVRSGTD